MRRHRCKGSPVIHPSTPLCRAFNMRRRRYKGSPLIHAFTPLCRASKHEACAWAENYSLVQKIVDLYLQPHWKKLHANLPGAAQGVRASVDGGAHWLAWTRQYAW